MSHFPEFEQLINLPNKGTLHIFQRSTKSLLPGIILFIFFTIVVFFLNIMTEGNLRIFGLIPFIILLETVRRYYDDLYIIGDDTISRKQGRLSLNYSISTIKYIDIRGVMISQSFWGRVLGYGDVMIGTAAQDEAELVLQNVDAPEELSKLIPLFRKHSQNQLTTSVSSVHND